jgi:hypothetical protein
MKSTITSILSSTFVASVLAIGTLASTQSASAQSSQVMSEVTIPFSFQTTTQKLPAGTYRVISETDHVIRLQGLSSKAGGFVVTHDAIKRNAPDHGSLVFARYGDSYYLHQIWTPGNTIGAECSKGRAEKESQVAKNDTTPSTVELAMNSIPKR